MKFRNEIELDLPADELFATLSDIERVAPCLPGARIEGGEGDEHRGAMRIKVGPVVVDYAGTVTIKELDPEARRAVLVARGQEKTGQGTAEANIVNSVEQLDQGSRIVVETDLQVKGKVAQFGSGPMEKIAKRMFAEFAKNLEAMMKGEGEPGAGAAGSATTVNAEAGSAGSAQRPAAEPASLDLVSMTLESVSPAALAACLAALALLIGFVLGRLTGGSS